MFSQGLLTDTKSVFVCLPGCQIKEFLCVGGSDRVYLTLQLLLWSKCPTVNAGHESHLALDRGSLFSGERGSCLEKIFNRRGVGWWCWIGVVVWGARTVLSAVCGHIVRLCALPQQWIEVFIAEQMYGVAGVTAERWRKRRWKLHQIKLTTNALPLSQRTGTDTALTLLYKAHQLYDHMHL